MHPKTVIRSLLALLLLTAAASVAAGNEESHPHTAIIAAVKAYLLQTVADGNSQAKIEVTPLDHRLKLRQCDTPLQAFSPPGGSKMGRTSVGIRCENPAPWSIYVSARVALEIPVVSAIRDLARGQAITRADVTLKTMDTTRLLRGYYDSIDEVVGRTLKRRLTRGKAVTPSLLVVQKTIKRGEQVTIVAATGTIEVRMQGKAMNNGNPGDLIPVVNVKSKKKLQARVVSEGLVRVD
ncbi:MAG: flagella basal body P-ring formation protein FlgA [gamma proteobacterium symbiont of Ctena orbiculata]|uniref:Flagella basal body P-ring formation protein FlgA n=1 Tax=Candidatus Thiodiazotropha taylori TaxID=2792791 RepID=A0A944M7W7_9GAMM|nr:flagellar basal body P-ring formation protein FlgA [Candidatus Thiodiazotropha taylori]PVV13347.1 MAG: flagella basal body P-ring formation protein FlgA [gamma proteobacterium symbiont of Ctena orbiculata]MBT3026183.1 flagellar basal body P-ring formation protein FlgA [Candidatus Thiodiazotropha taylori]MBT3035886.1 flagellar basal body P-ring formation protein FlgA [Candidatus Thiodiazotropha taylori]MBV2135995.1 flagellar basal body P-ring formation protein FlgA [Candidatus Thiodiazotropha